MMKNDFRRPIALLALFFGSMTLGLLNGQVFTNTVIALICGVIALVCGFTSARNEKTNKDRRWVGRFLGGCGLVLTLICLMLLPSTYQRQKKINNLVKKVKDIQNSIASATPKASQPNPVGTWQWIRVDQQSVKEPFHVRYYADGIAATWPAPADWPTTTNGVSRGRYHMDGNSLVVETGAGTNDPKARVEITGNEMTLFGRESNKLVYRRVVPDLEPGK